MSKIYKIETKSDKVLVQAEDRDQAFASYFKDIIQQKIPLERLGNIIILHDGKEDYAFRTVPLLWKMGIINEQLAVANLIDVLGVKNNEARRMLKKCGEADARLIPLIEDLILKESD